MAKIRLEHFFKTAKQEERKEQRVGSAFVQVENSYEVKVDEGDLGIRN